MKAIMYHYVRPYNEKLPYFKNLHIDDFKKQLDFFEKEYGFVSKEDFVNSFNCDFKSKGVVLTFDDGLKCHYEYVYKELIKRNLWGIFYIPTQAYVTNKVLDVHRIHLLLGMHSGEIVYKKLFELLSDVMFSTSIKKEFKTLTYIDQNNDDYSLQVKRILNYYIEYNYREEILDELMNQLIPEENSKASNIYLSKSEINEMAANGMIIGSHTVSHPVMAKLNIETQRTEIVDSFEFINQTIKKSTVKTFCYPYGGFHNFTLETEKILEEENCLFSFNVEHRDIDINDIRNRPQALPRYDCNHFNYGDCR